MEEDESEERINVKSEHFDPLQALYSEKLIVPFPSAPILDNVAKADSLLLANKNLDEKVPHTRKAKKEVLEPTTSKAVIPELPTGPVRPGSKNILTQMAEMTGPLAFLKTCIEKRIRIKVWTRGPREIRGYCIGFVVAFDKHWNLALIDVQEVWKRRAKRKTLFHDESKTLPLAWRAMGPMVKPPKVVVKSVEKGGMEVCERHVNQMLMRGEQIAFISISGT